MSIGFTGTRAGMSVAQRHTLRLYLTMFRDLHGPEFRHGKAIGSDLEVAAIATELGYEEVHFRPERDPLERNRLIVLGSDFMFTTPNTHYEVLRSGTWATIRFANKVGVPGITIWPDGNSSPMTAMNHLHNMGR